MRLHKKILVIGLAVILALGVVGCSKEGDLIEAVKQGEAPQVRKLINEDVKVDIEDENGTSLLKIAEERGNPQIYQLVKIAHPEEEVDVSLMEAIQKGYLETAKLLVEQGAEVDQRNESGATPLIAAVYENHPDVVQVLIDNEADVNATFMGEVSPLMLSLSIEDSSLEVVEKLVKAGAEVNVTNKNKVTPLMLAAYRGKVEEVKYLLEQGAEVEQENVKGDTALDAAEEQGHSEVVEVLEEAQE